VAVLDLAPEIDGNRALLDTDALHFSDVGQQWFAEQIARAAELHRAILALVEIEPTHRLLGLMVLATVARPGAAEALRTLRKSGHAVSLACADAMPQHKDALASLGLGDAAAGSTQSAIGIVRPGQAPIESTDITVRFGARPGSGDGYDVDVVIARDDPRTLVDLLRFARDFRRSVRLAIVVASLPGLALLAAALGYLPASPLLISGAALAGIALAVAAPQALRLSPATANEVDEE
jgi:cation transport ATPase